MQSGRWRFGAVVFGASGWALAGVLALSMIVGRGADESPQAAGGRSLVGATDGSQAPSRSDVSQGANGADAGDLTSHRGCSAAEYQLAECRAEVAMHLGVAAPWPENAGEFPPEEVVRVTERSLADCLGGIRFASEIDCSEYPCMVWVMSAERLDKRMFCDSWVLDRSSLSYRSGVAVGSGLEAVQFAVSIPDAPLPENESNAERRWDFRTDAAAEWVFDALRERLEQPTLDGD